MQATAADFIGTWRLLDYSFIHEDGTVEHPWGTAVRGYLLYSAEGYMSGNLSPANDWPSRRARLKAAWKAHDGAGAFRLARNAGRRDYIAYTGRYTVEAEHRDPPRRGQPVSQLGGPPGSAAFPVRRQHPHAADRPRSRRKRHHHCAACVGARGDWPSRNTLLRAHLR